MNPAVQKTLSLLLLIGVGIIIRSKLKSKESLLGVKVLILSIALPATIFVALLKVEIETHLLFLPLIALGFNLLLLGVVFKVLPLMGISRDEPKAKTLMMLLPSLAPGLSCFPFLAEYMGDESLALAALADVGNKIFVLILLYMLAMHWYYKEVEFETNSNGRLKSLALSLLKEPVNLLIICALILLSFDLNINALPAFMQSAVMRMSAMMTPMILIFIGMAVKIKWEQMRSIFTLLALRSGFAFILSALLILILPAMVPAALMVVVVFPQSACSFWPFAHMAAVDTLEEKKTKKTFDTDFGLSVLACSLPFSTILILAICSLGETFLNPYILMLTAVIMFAVALIPRWLSFSSWKATRIYKTTH